MEAGPRQYCKTEGRLDFCSGAKQVVCRIICPGARKYCVLSRSVNCPRSVLDELGDITYRCTRIPANFPVEGELSALSSFLLEDYRADNEKACLPISTTISRQKSISLSDLARFCS